MSGCHVELRAHSWYSFGTGTASLSALARQAADLECPALGLTDTGNLCGALEFAQACDSAGVTPLFGLDLTVREGEASGPVTLLASDGEGYANLCRLSSLAHLVGGRATPALDVGFLDEHSGGVIALLGAPGSVLADTIDTGRWEVARQVVDTWTGQVGVDGVYLQLQQHLAYGDTARNRRMAELADRCGVGVVATNEPWYLQREDSRLHDALTAIRLNSTLAAARSALKPNSHYWLKPPDSMRRLFRRYPQALSNTLAIAEAMR